MSFCFSSFFLPFPESTSSPPENSTGQKFIVAFPENIAHYYPDHPQNKVKITALHHNTEIIIKMYDSYIDTLRLNAGDVQEFAPEAKLELSRLEISNKTLQITSNKRITVLAINLKKHSLQTVLVTPTDKLGTEYLIPPVPVINGTTHPVDQVTRYITERSPFKLIIINTDQDNMVTVTGAVPQKVSLQPHQVAQIWLKEEQALRAVKAEQPVAVLFGHTCAIQHNCTCGQLYTMLPAAREEEQKFYIPPFLTKDAEDETFVLLSEKESTQVRPFNPNLPLLKSAGTAVLYRPGLLLTLIPEMDFGTCSVVNSIPDAENFAVIVVHKNRTAGVHLGSHPLEISGWQQLDGTDYVSTHVVLTSDKNIFWHSFSKMVVYFVGNKEGTMFGNPAAIISKTPGMTPTNTFIFKPRFTELRKLQKQKLSLF